MRILGLDIGSTSIKAIELNSAFGRSEVQEYYELEVPTGTAPAVAAAELIASLKKKPDRVITNVKSNRVTFRNLKLPTRDKRAIQSSVRFEIEDDLPFEEDDLIYDWVNLGAVGHETAIHVAATLKTNVAEYLALLGESGVDPDVLTTEASAYRALFRKISSGLTATDRPIMLVNLGHERTTIYVQHLGNPVLCREIAWGSREMSIALSKRYNLTIEAAEKAKIESGFVLPITQMEQVSEEQRDFAASVYECLAPLIRDVKQADLSSKTVTAQRVGSIYLAGPTALMPGLSATFAEEMKISTHILRPLSSLGESRVTYSEQTDVRFPLALGLALAATSPERSVLVNLRKKEFARTSSGPGLNLSLVAKPMKTLSVAMVLAIIILFTQSSMIDSQIKDSSTGLEKATRNFFSGIAPGTLKNYMANTSSLKRAVDSELNKERSLLKLLEPDPSSPFDFLKDLSAAVSRDVVTDLMKFSQSSATATSQVPSEMEFWVASPQVGERLKNAVVSRFPQFKTDSMTDVTGADGLKKYKLVFRMSASGATGGKKDGK